MVVVVVAVVVVGVGVTCLLHPFWGMKRKGDVGPWFTSSV